MPPTYPQFVTGDAINLSGLFKWRKEALDPVLDAKTGPGYFSAKCGFTAQLLLMGGNCQAQLGWYNVLDPASKSPPAANEIYPFVGGKPQDQLNCVELDGKARKTDGFCPLAWDNLGPHDLSIKRWTPTLFPSGDRRRRLQRLGVLCLGFDLRRRQSRLRHRTVRGVLEGQAPTCRPVLKASGGLTCGGDGRCTDAACVGRPAPWVRRVSWVCAWTPAPAWSVPAAVCAARVSVVRFLSLPSPPVAAARYPGKADPRERCRRWA